MGERSDIGAGEDATADNYIPQEISPFGSKGSVNKGDLGNIGED